MASEETVTEQDLVRWSEMLSALARTGLAFTESLYETERFEEILAVASEIGASTSLPIDSKTLLQEWTKTIGHGVPGYVTPKNTVGAIVGNDDGELLLVQRSDSGVWLYPTGWADVGYSPAEVAEKEVQEETGIECRVERPIAILDGLRAGFGRVPLYSIVFLCRATGGELAAHPQECLDVGWFTRDDLPEPVANAELWVDHAFASIEGSADDVFFDLPRDQVWQGPQP